MEDQTITDGRVQIDVSKHEDEKTKESRLMAYAFKMVRAESGMNRKDFAEWLGIPYRTMQEWELERRTMPQYVFDLIAYKVRNEKEKGNI